jgi:hypothetical protein
MIDVTSEDTIDKLKGMTSAEIRPKEDTLVFIKGDVRATVRETANGITVAVSVSGGAHLERVKKDPPETVTGLYSAIHSAIGTTARKLERMSSACAQASAGHSSLQDLTTEDYIGISL